jgi:citrate lyase alpha subunit
VVNVLCVAAGMPCQAVGSGCDGAYLTQAAVHLAPLIINTVNGAVHGLFL